MPRPTITTVYNPRAQPSTQYLRPRECTELSWDTNQYRFDTTEITFDTTLIEWCLTTVYNSTRQFPLFLLENWLQFKTEADELFELEWGYTDNKIQTVYT